MKKTAVILMMAVMASAAMADDVTVSLSADLASAYVFRGTTFNDGLVLQPGMEIGGLPVTVGVWANFDIDDYDGNASDTQFSEIDISAGYDLPIEGLSLGYCEYTYPGAAGEADREISLSYEFPLPLTPSVSVNYGLDGSIDKSLYVEAGVSHEMKAGEDITLSFGAAVAYADIDGGESGFSHYAVSAGASYGIASLTLNYVGQIDDDVLVDAGMSTPAEGEEAEFVYGYDTEFFAVLGIAQEF